MRRAQTGGRAHLADAAGSPLCSLAVLPPQVNRRYLGTLMPEFAADCLASDGILRASGGYEHPRSRTAGGGRLPAGKRLVPDLRTLMPQPVHVAQAGRLALAVEVWRCWM